MVLSRWVQSALIFFFFCMVLFPWTGCQKIEPTRVVFIRTDNVTNVSNNSCQAVATLVDAGEGKIIQHGFCWAESENPTLDKSKCQLGAITNTGEFEETLTGLAENKTYYVRAYAQEADQVFYGEQISFKTTSGNLPTVVTSSVTEVTSSSAVCGGTVADEGGSPISRRGVCWNTEGNPTTSDKNTNEGTGGGSYTSLITGLDPNTRYYVRAYAVNSTNTGYGNEIEFVTVNQTSGSAPVANFSVSNVSIPQNGTAEFTDLSSGNPVSWSWNFGDGGTSTAQNPSHTYTNPGAFTVSLTVTNDYGSDTETKTDYITVGSAPVANFTASPTSVSTGQNIQFTDQSGNGPTGWSWDFGDGGSSSEQNPSHSYSSNGTYTVSLTVTNGFGSDTETKSGYITVVAETTVNDYDGNIYPIVVIGSQSWMGENLRTTHYANGTAIPLVTGTSAWSSLSTTDKAYCYYDNSSGNGNNYGALYTWAAAMNGQSSSSANPSGVQGVCPSGWHLPSDDEWKELEKSLGMSQADADDESWRGTDQGSQLAGIGGLWTDGALKSSGSFGDSEFNIVPGGIRYIDGVFYNLGSTANYWTATQYSSTFSIDRAVFWDHTQISRYHSEKQYGFSVRCVKD